MEFSLTNSPDPDNSSHGGNNFGQLQWDFEH